MRPSEEMKTYMDEMKNKLKFHGPIVGIHVRRTDKVSDYQKL